MPRHSQTPDIAIDDRLKYLLDRLPDAMLVVEPPRGVIWANSLAEKLFGRPRGDLIGLQAESLLPPRFREAHAVHCRQYAAAPTARPMGVGMEFLALRGDGVEFPVEVSLSPMPAGDRTCILVAIRDITDRLAARDALHEADARFKAIFDHTFQFIGLITPDGAVLEVNQTAYDFGGLRREDVVGKPFWEARWWAASDETQDRLRRAIARAAAGEFVRYEVEVRGAGDEVALIDFSIKPVFDPQGRVRVLIPEGRDVTDLRRAQRALTAVEAELDLARQIQSRLLPRAAPDLPRFDLAGRVRPAARTAGDYYDYLPLDTGELYILLGDVIGHGVPAALLEANVHAYARAARVRDAAGPGQFVAALNQLLWEDTQGESFVSMLLVLLDPVRRQLRYVNAGHPAARLLGPDGALRASLDSTGPVLGPIQGARFDVVGPLDLHPGDVLCLWTDGVLEAFSPRDECFGLDRALDVVRRRLRQTSREIADALIQAVEDFCLDSRPHDDLSVVVLKTL